jgi:hypothetical protein
VVAPTLVAPETLMTLKTLKTVKALKALEALRGMLTPMTGKAVIPAVLLVASLGFACGSSTTSPSTTSPTTDTISSTALYPGGADFEDITVTPGTVTAMLTSTTPPNVVLGFGIGLKSGNTCYLTTSVNAQAGAQLSLPVDGGTYCIEVYDNGTLTGQVQFAMTVTHP